MEAYIIRLLCNLWHKEAFKLLLYRDDDVQFPKYKHSKFSFWNHIEGVLLDKKSFLTLDILKFFKEGLYLRPCTIYGAATAKMPTITSKK